ncbi:hypothetical protein V8C43DRAFT_284254 [Trichoderma afarasin]
MTVAPCRVHRHFDWARTFFIFIFFLLWIVFILGLQAIPFCHFFLLRASEFMLFCILICASQKRKTCVLTNKLFLQYGVVLPRKVG